MENKANNQRESFESPYAYFKIINEAGKIVDLAILDVNASFLQLFKVNQTDLLGRSMSHFFPQLDLFKLLNEIDQNLKANNKQILSNFVLNDEQLALKIIIIEQDKLLIFFDGLINDMNQDELESKKYQLIIERLADFLWVIDFKWHFRYFNKCILNHVGYSEEEVLKLGFQHIVNKESYQKALSIIEKERKRVEDHPGLDQSFTFEIDVIKKDGSIIILHNNVNFELDEHGYPVALIGLSRDITAKKAHFKKIEEDEEILRLIYDTANEGIIGVDASGRCAFYNQTSLKILGLKNPQDLLGKNIGQFFRQSQNSTDYLFDDSKINQAIEFGMQLINEEALFERLDGTTFYSEYSVYPKYDEVEIKGAIITFSDITKRKKVELELRESERSKSVLLDNLPGIAYRCLYDRDWTMIFISDGCTELTGYPPESLLYNRDLSFNDIISPSFRSYLWKKWQEVVQNYGLLREEYIIITANKELKWVLEQGQAIYDNTTGEVIALEGLIIDITEQKRKQEEIEFLSYHDSLTGIYNRLYFEEIKKTFDNENFLPLTIILSDINGLKIVNDAIGHAEGDGLIIRTANLLKRFCRKDDVIARVGGDEFALLLPQTTEEDAYIILKEIEAACKQHNQKVHNELEFINISLGFATKTTMDQDLAQVERVAEDYMYRRKLLERSSTHSSILSLISSTMYEKSQETEAHSERLKKLSRVLGTKMKLTENELNELELLAALHDIGKVTIDEKILNKPGKLTPEEWVEIKKHPEAGYRIAMATPRLISIADYILSHYERWDGQGYPQGLKEEEIPLLSRILSVIDAYDVMTEYRSYRSAITKEEALIEIKRCSGTQFDPHIAKIFIQLMKENPDL